MKIARLNKKIKFNKKNISTLIFLILIIIFSQLSPEQKSNQQIPNPTPSQEKTVRGIQDLKATISQSPSSTLEIPILSDSAGTPALEQAALIRVVDGDTIKASINGSIENIRIIGINTPEVVDPRKPVECFGKEASQKAKDIFKDQSKIYLESDDSQGDRDKYNRLLRYVWIDNGELDYGKQMIYEGYAYEYTYDLPYKYQAEYKNTQTQAQVSKKGLWSDDACPK